MEADEREWVRRMARGEAGGLAALYDRYGDAIYRFCFRLSGSASDAEDLTQEVFVAAWEGAGRFAGRASPRTWLYRIALFRWRARARRPVPAGLNEDASGMCGPDPAFRSLERLSLADALEALPGDLRDAFLLVKAEGLTYREAAGALGIPQGTVQSRVHDAVRRLRVLLAEEEYLADAM